MSAPNKINRESLPRGSPRFPRSPSSSSLSEPRTTEPGRGTGRPSSSDDLPPITQPNIINVILFGDTGIGRCSVINLIAQEHIANTSSDDNGCTMESTPYNISFDDIYLTIFDTVALEEPEIGFNGLLITIDKASKLISKLEAVGGIHLLLFCMRGARITATEQSNYRMFCECLCEGKVPIGLVFTGLEREADMEQLWERNKSDIACYGIHSHGHACITTVNDGTPEELAKYKESQQKIRSLIRRCALEIAATSEPLPWLERFALAMTDILNVPKRQDAARRKILMLKVLTLRCHLAPEVAERIADLAVGGVNPKPNGNETKMTAGEKEYDGGQYIETGEKDDEVSIDTTSCVPGSILLPPIQAPEIRIKSTILYLWRHGVFKKTEELLSEGKSANENRSHVLACRALVRSRLQRWEDAIDDAEKSIEIEPSALGYIAKSMALVGKGEKDKVHRICDIALAHFHSAHVSFLLLIKAVVIFMTGDRNDAISRLDDLIASIQSNSLCYLVQAYMYLLIGDTQTKDKDYAGAIESFELAQPQVQDCASGPLVVISLITGWKFNHLEIEIRKRRCEALYAIGHMKEAVQSFLEVLNTSDILLHMPSWVSDFKFHCYEKLERSGDLAMEMKRHDEAIDSYSTALFLDPSHQGFLVKRSKARMAKGLLDEALNDVNEVIVRDPSSPLGYEIKHAILHKAKRYADAVIAFQTMLSIMKQSPDRNIRGRYDEYITPSDTRMTIRDVVKQTTDHLPRVLINTSTGRLQNRAEQVFTFESSPIFHELLSSMTTHIDSSRIEREVRQYFQYVMLSHKWQENEPLFQDVIHIAVHDLGESPTHNKLKKFCRIAQDSGYNWAWSDTCCIDKRHHAVHHEAIVAMFKWYSGAALVIVYLLGIRSESGDLMGSIWSKRAWTFQEYVAAQVVRFYTEDWTLYRQLEAKNHKKSREIIFEMEKTTGVSARRLRALSPGLDNVREKLYLASGRETTEIEDAAYSLFGIFSVTGITPNYGERESALGRLLVYLLSGSGDISILAWTGDPGVVNSCLPASIAVYSEPETSYLPLPIKDNEMEETLARVRRATPNLELSQKLYIRLNKLDMASFEANRLQLPCVALKLSPPSVSPGDRHSSHVYHSETSTFGIVKIKTQEDLSPHLNSLYLLHPWLDALLGREHVHVGAFAGGHAIKPFSLEVDEEDPDGQDIGEDRGDCSPQIPEIRQLDENMRALQLIARLRQPFGAILFVHMMTRGEKKFGMRVAADSLITVQIAENVPLEELLNSIDTLNIL